MRSLPVHALCLSAIAILQLHLSSAVGPVVDRNYPDRCIAQSQSGEWFVFSTKSDGINIQMASSTDFGTWTFHEGYDALPTLPPWTRQRPHARVWAPDLYALPDGDGWIMYFAAVGHSHPERHCIGTARATTIQAPYQPDPEPFICDLPRGGNIDPNLFHDPINQRPSLVYKVDGNGVGHRGACGNTKAKIAPTPMYIQEPSPDDLVSKIGEPVFLASNLNPEGSFKFDGPNTERPSIVFRNGTCYLLYNAQCYAELKYRIDFISCIAGVDTHDGIVGCDWAGLKAAQQNEKVRTLLKTSDEVSGVKLHVPGSMDSSPDGHNMVFHGDVNLGWFEPHGKPVARKRAMFAAEIDYVRDSGDLVVVKLF